MAKRKKKPPVPPVQPPHAPGGDPAAPLAEDEQRFIEEYLVDRRPVLAYMRANPLVTVYRTAMHHASILMGRAHVRAEIRAGVDAISRRNRVRADAVLRELARVAFSDVWDLYDSQTGLLRHPREIPLDSRRAIAQVTVSRERRTARGRGTSRTVVTESIVSYRFWPKLDALGQLCKYLGLDNSIEPLDALLLALPPALSAAVRVALAGRVGGPVDAAAPDVGPASKQIQVHPNP